MVPELKVILIVFAVLLPLIIVITFYLCSKEGWSDLGEHYRCDRRPEGKFFRFRSVRFGIAGYNNAISIGFCEEGLYLSQMIPIVLFHPPLLIPWEEFHSTRLKREFGLFLCTVTFVSQPVVTQMILPKFVYEELMARQPENDIST
ncbi:MAG: hypothetical protein HUJ26_02965 [Planctomycetaceae bacterium]|nr:hypothetical protein [Planctomycetaceae bacterium]